MDESFSFLRKQLIDCSLSLFAITNDCRRIFARDWHALVFLALGASMNERSFIRYDLHRVSGVDIKFCIRMPV